MTNIIEADFIKVPNNYAMTNGGLIEQLKKALAETVGTDNEDAHIHGDVDFTLCRGEWVHVLKALHALPPDMKLPGV